MDRDKAWAVVRVVLGLAQVMAATVAAYLLVRMGTETPTLVAATVALLLVLVSRLLFGGAGPGGPQ